MQSLRTRKSSAPSPAKPQRQGTKLAKPTRDARKSRIDDKIKKRMSMRYADISAPTDVNIPAVPSLPVMDARPGREQDEVVKDRGPVKEDPRLSDKRILDKEDFDPDACEYY